MVILAKIKNESNAVVEKAVEFVQKVYIIHRRSQLWGGLKIEQVSTLS